jgi:hypothetical protein
VIVGTRSGPLDDPRRPAGPRTDDDLGDPYGAPLQAFRVRASLIREALTGPISLIAAATGDYRPGG